MWRTLTIVLASLLTVSTPVLAQQAPERTLGGALFALDAQGDAIALLNNELTKGQFRSVPGTSLSDALRRQRNDGQQSNGQPKSWPARHPVLMGLMIGAGAGAAWGAVSDVCAIDNGGQCPGPNSVIGAGVWGGIGALIGLVAF
jgi:hypothetical protein